jgi:thymidylate synthase ThyX
VTTSSTLPDGIGYVELDDCTDFDKDVARIARASTGSENKGLRADRKLLATLMREDHGSPVEMGLIRFKIEDAAISCSAASSASNGQLQSEIRPVRGV